MYSFLMFQSGTSSWCSISLEPVHDVPPVWIQFSHQWNCDGNKASLKTFGSVSSFPTGEEVGVGSHRCGISSFTPFHFFAILGTLPPPTGPEEWALNWFHRSGPTFMQQSTTFQFLFAKKLGWMQHKDASVYFLFCSVSSWKRFFLVCLM